jgi:2-dehydro-3-deoxygluconokinase
MAKGGVAAIGECMLELSGAGDDLWRLGFAGDTFNTLWAVRALTNRTCDYVSAFGDDAFSQRQIAFFESNGIGIAASPVIAGARPGLYAITLTGAERSFTYWRNDAAARQLARDAGALAESLKHRELIYFSGITLAILDEQARETLLGAIGSARAAGSRIAFDPNYRPRLWRSPTEAREATDRALAVSDIALPTFPDEQMLYGDASPDDTAARLQRAGVSEIVVKNGAEDAVLASSGSIEPVPAVTVHDSVDTTGAGDGFNGGYLSARLEDSAPAEAARRGHAVAAAVVRVRGALAPFETLRSAFSPA